MVTRVGVPYLPRSPGSIRLVVIHEPHDLDGKFHVWKSLSSRTIARELLVPPIAALEEPAAGLGRIPVPRVTHAPKGKASILSAGL